MCFKGAGPNDGLGRSAERGHEQDDDEPRAMPCETRGLRCQSGLRRQKPAEALLGTCRLSRPQHPWPHVGPRIGTRDAHATPLMKRPHPTKYGSRQTRQIIVPFVAFHFDNVKVQWIINTDPVS